MKQRICLWERGVTTALKLHLKMQEGESKEEFTRHPEGAVWERQTGTRKAMRVTQTPSEIKGGNSSWRIRYTVKKATQKLLGIFFYPLQKKRNYGTEKSADV